MYSTVVNRVKGVARFLIRWAYLHTDFCLHYLIIYNINLISSFIITPIVISLHKICCAPIFCGSSSSILFFIYHFSRRNTHCTPNIRTEDIRDNSGKYPFLIPKCVPQRILLLCQNNNVVKTLSSKLRKTANFIDRKKKSRNS